eukprot:TRINITY_DN43384_c0_g1_i1.p1 TRINITY_DN43384_c0_g1~~TRINITY_DN43384_c0_g1_i1.p1  ORF type:complete len:271 (-),score=45.91 TRINITY_DN43384_c0_g1_i1:5-817(-)
MKSLLWTVLLLTLLFYAFGVALTQLTSDYCRFTNMQSTGNVNASPVCKHEGLKKYWGSISESMLTLFMAVTGGVSWEHCLEPLRGSSGVAAVIFVVYLSFTILALLNVVTGVFCHSAIESAASDKDIAAMIQLQNHKEYVDTIRRMFTEIDDDDSKGISIKEFAAALRNEHLSAYLESIDISTADAWTLFKLIDADENGNVDIDEFVTGSLSLRGNAKAMQVAMMRVESGKHGRKIDKLFARANNLEDAVSGLVQRVDTFLHMLQAASAS